MKAPNEFDVNIDSCKKSCTCTYLTIIKTCENTAVSFYLFQNTKMLELMLLVTN